MNPLQPCPILSQIRSAPFVSGLALSFLGIERGWAAWSGILSSSVTEGQLQVEALKPEESLCTQQNKPWWEMRLSSCDWTLSAAHGRLLAVFQGWGVSLWFSLHFWFGVKLRGEHPDSTSLCFWSFQQHKDFTAYLIQSLWASVEKCTENDFESVCHIGREKSAPAPGN